MPFAQLEDFKMHYEVYEGIVPRDTLVIHGNLASNRWFHRAVAEWKAITATDHHLLPGKLVLAEWRGCGDSSAPQSRDELKLENLANDYIALLRYLGISKCSVIGHSTGGAIALLAMARAPQLFDRAVLLNPIGPIGPKGVSFAPAILDGFEKMRTDREYCASRLQLAIHNSDSRSDLFDSLVDDAFKVAKENWLGIPYHLSQLDITADVKQVTHPVQILHGEFDNVLPISGSRELKSLLPNAKFVELKNQGHSACFENPQLFVKLTNEFLYAI